MLKFNHFGHILYFILRGDKNEKLSKNDDFLIFFSDLSLGFPKP